MEQQTYAFVRSRTYYQEYDFRLLTPITNIPKTTHQYFEKCVQNILSDSSFNEKPWDEPTWLFIKQDKYILWGVACNNKIFSEDCYYEEYAERPVRCFCGVVYVNTDLHSLKLPYNVHAFQPVFDCTIKQLWKQRVYEMPNVIVSLESVDEYITPSGWQEKLNDNPRICRLHPASSNVKELLSACITSPVDISLAANVMTRDQVYNQKKVIAIRNAVMRQGTSTIDIPIKQKCKKCGTWVDELTDGLCNDCRKKDDTTDPKVPDHEESQEVLYTCARCGKQTEWVNEKGLCADCADKQYRKQLIRYIIIGLLVLFCICIKMCSAEDTQHYTQDTLENSAKQDTVIYKTDTINLSSQKQ